jgi:hypothetical protein
LPAELADKGKGKPRAKGNNPGSSSYEIMSNDQDVDDP